MAARVAAIEAEIRSFITQEEYERLKELLLKNASGISEDYQETFYFDSKEDLRIQKNDNYSKVWLKKGRMHDDAREEIEVHFAREDFSKLESLFSSLGYGIQIKWFRKRFQCTYKGSTICLDYTKGYGYIIEIERMCSEDEKDDAAKTIRSQLESFGIALTPKEEFSRRFENYKKNWKELIR